MSTPAKMRLLPEYIEAIREGRKTTTIRIGKRGVATSELIFESDTNSIKVQVLSVHYRKFRGPFAEKVPFNITTQNWVDT